MFCENFHTQAFTLHTLRLVLLWGCPEHTLLPNTLHTAWRGYPTAQRLQETTIQPREATLWPTDFRRPPYGQETAPTVSPAYPAYPSFRNRHTHGTQCTQPSRRPQEPDYKTTRLHCQPTESIMPRGGKIQRKPDRGKYREIAWRRQIQRKA